eukprot:364554-Chlamydomonas_euryale.AAC.8
MTAAGTSVVAHLLPHRRWHLSGGTAGTGHTPATTSALAPQRWHRCSSPGGGSSLVPSQWCGTAAPIFMVAQTAQLLPH